jgi:hypothetical protein
MEYPCWLNSGLLVPPPPPPPLLSPYSEEEVGEINTLMLALNDKKNTSFPSCPLAISTILVIKQSVI